MPQQILPYDYNALASSLLNKLLPIFGRDVVIQIVFSVPEIQIDPKFQRSRDSKIQRFKGAKVQRSRDSEVQSGIASSQAPRNDEDSGQARMTGQEISIKSIQGDSAVVFDKLVEEFVELSPFVVKRVLGDLEGDHGENGSKGLG